MAWKYDVKLDRKTLVIGTFSAGTTTWVLPFKDASLTTTNCRIVLGDAFGILNGTVLTPATVTTGVGITTITVAGNYGGGAVVIGRTFTSRLQLLPPYRRDQNGIAQIGDELLLTSIKVAFHESGHFDVRQKMPFRTDLIDGLRSTGGLIAKQGAVRFNYNGSVDDMTLFIESTHPKPAGIVSLEYALDVHREDN